MKYNFREWLREKELNESIKERIFKLNINDIEYTIFRDDHLFDNSRGDNKPKDSNMSKNKYQNVFNTFFNTEHNLKLNKTITVTWESQNNKNNALSFGLAPKTKLITVFGAIMNGKSKDPSKLYSSVTNRIHLGKVN